MDNHVFLRPLAPAKRSRISLARTVQLVQYGPATVEEFLSSQYEIGLDAFMAAIGLVDIGHLQSFFHRLQQDSQQLDAQLQQLTRKKEELTASCEAIRAQLDRLCSIFHEPIPNSPDLFPRLAFVPVVVSRPPQQIPACYSGGPCACPEQSWTKSPWMPSPRSSRMPGVSHSAVIKMKRDQFTESNYVPLPRFDLILVPGQATGNLGERTQS